MTNVVPKVAELTKRSSREVQIVRGGEGDPLGAAVWLNADELAALGVNMEVTDSIRFAIIGDHLQIEPAEKSEE